jgi:tyrosyl-tRNA synthetase
MFSLSKAYQKQEIYARFISYMNQILHRGVEGIFPSAEFLKKRLSENKPLKVYLGIDPTGPTLHIGHAIALKKLKEFQDLGHKVILLMGDFTALIGDPTDKAAVRKQLTEKEIKQNLKLYKKQASKIIRFSGKNPAKIAFNSKWLKKMGMKDVLELTSMMTVDQMLKRDMFAKRIEEDKPIYIHEFMYPLLQGYDSVAMDVDVEIGGNDQMFNMLVGRDFQKKLHNKEKIAITVKLLTDSTGKKMGKTEGNMVSLNDTPTDMFGKIMSWTDGMIANGFELCTFVSDDELNQIKKTLESGMGNPRDLKVRLAKEIVQIYHGEVKADEAVQYFNTAFSNKEIPENVESFTAPIGSKVGNLLVEHKIVSSMGEFKRLIGEKAIKIDGTVEIEDFGFTLEKDIVLKVGKKRFVAFKVK